MDCWAPEWDPIEELIAIAKADKGNIKQVKAFWQQWVDKFENCNGRVKSLRSFFERQLDLVGKLFNISSDMTEDSNKTETEENKRRNLDPIFSEKFTETMAESVAASDRKFQDTMVSEIEKNIK